MGIIQLVLADWPVSIIETASVLVKRKLYTCTYSYMISIFVFLLERVNTIINSLKCYLCLHSMTFLIAEFMFLSTRWYKDLSDSSYGEVKWYSMSMIWIKDIVHCTYPSLKNPWYNEKKKQHSLKGMLNWHGNAQTALLFVYHMHQRHRRPLSTN